MKARECYIAMLELDDHLQALNIEERQVTVELIEDLEEISLDDDCLGRITRIGTQVEHSIRKELTLFLKNNQDVFAWSHEDMLGINPSVMVHKLKCVLNFPSRLIKGKSICSRKGQISGRSLQVVKSQFH